jgi:hypothetical protein
MWTGSDRLREWCRGVTGCGHYGGVEVLAGRFLFRPVDLDRSRLFYRMATNLAVSLRVRDVTAERGRSGLGIEVVGEPRCEPWGWIEMWIAGPGA